MVLWSNNEYLADLLPNSEVHPLDAGHFAWEQASDEYGRLIVEWGRLVRKGRVLIVDGATQELRQTVAPPLGSLERPAARGRAFVRGRRAGSELASPRVWGLEGRARRERIGKRLDGALQVARRAPSSARPDEPGQLTSVAQLDRPAVTDRPDHHS